MTTAREPVSLSLDETQLRKSLATSIKQLKESNLKNLPLQEAEALLKTTAQPTKEVLQAEIERIELLTKHSESLKKIKSMIPGYKTAITDLRQQTNKLEALKKQLEAAGGQLAELKEINELLRSSQTFFGNGFEDTFERERDFSTSTGWRNPDELTNVAIKLEALSLTVDAQYNKLRAYNQSHTMSAIKENYSQQVEQLFTATRGDFLKLAEHFRDLEKKVEMSPAIKETICSPLEQEIKKLQNAFNTLREQFDKQSTSVLGIKNDSCSLETFLGIQNQLALLSKDIQSTASKVATQDKTVTAKQTAKKNLQEKAVNARAAADQLSNLIAKTTDNSNQLQARDTLLYTLYQNHHIECDKIFTNDYSIKELVKAQRVICSGINKSLRQEYDALDQLDKYIKTLPDDMLTDEQYTVCVAKQQKLEETLKSINDDLKEATALEIEQTGWLNKAERDLKNARDTIASRRNHYTIETDPAIRKTQELYTAKITTQQANQESYAKQRKAWETGHKNWIKTLRENFKQDIKKTVEEIDKAIKDDKESISSKILAIFSACLPFIKNSTQESLKRQKASLSTLACIYDEHCDDLEKATSNPHQPIRHQEQFLRAEFEKVPRFKKASIYLANTESSFLDKKRMEHDAQLSGCAQKIAALTTEREEEIENIKNSYTKKLAEDEQKITALLSRSPMITPKVAPSTPISTPRRISEEPNPSLFNKVSTLFAATQPNAVQIITKNTAKRSFNPFD